MDADSDEDVEIDGLGPAADEWQTTSAIRGDLCAFSETLKQSKVVVSEPRKQKAHYNGTSKTNINKKKARVKEAGTVAQGIGTPDIRSFAGFT